MRCLLIGLSVMVLTACGTTPPSILASTPRPSESEPRTFEEPAGALEFALQPVNWAPAVIGPASAADLSTALQKKQSLMILTGPGMQDAAAGDRIFQMVKAAAPEISIVARNPGVLDEIMLERGEIPYRQTVEVGGQDILGRPWFLPKDHPLKTDWLNKKKLLKGAEAILIIDYVTPDEQKLRQMREAVQGGCGELQAELQRGIGQSAAYFDSIVNQVNQALSEDFARQLETALPFWNDELKQALASTAPGSQEARCYTAYQKFLSHYDDCRDAQCAVGPALHVQGAGVIGMELSGAAIIPHTCPVGMGRNYVDEVSAIGEQVSRQVMKEIPDRWAGEFSKVRMLEQLDAEVADLCAPAHRRYLQQDLENAQTSVNQFLQQVVAEKQVGRWESADGEERVAGVGAVRVFGRAKIPSVETAALQKELAQMFEPLNKCRDSKRRPVQVVLVDVESSEVYFSSIVFEEQLFCENLPPR